MSLTEILSPNIPTAIVSSNIRTASIVKRDGRTTPFCLDKIASAIQKAFHACGGDRDEKYLLQLAQQVDDQLTGQNIAQPTVEQVQDVVERVLIENGHVRTAKAYMLYRAERTRIRERNTRLMKTYEDITFKSSKESEIKRENANVNGDTAMGTMLKYGSEGAKQFYEMFVLNPKHAAAHRDGDIHIHDLDFLTMTTTCCQIDLLKLFQGGFCTGHGVLREPNDIQSYSALACIAIQSNQNDQHGGQSIVNFDYGLAPGVAKTFCKLYSQNLAKGLRLLTGYENADEKIKSLQKTLLDAGYVLRLEENEDYCNAELRRLADEGFESDVVCRCQQFALETSLVEIDRATFQAMEALVHNLNTMHSRAGAQTPFSSINYGMDTSPEGRMVSKNILLAHERGLGGGETPIFPIHVFRVKTGVNCCAGEPNYDLFQLACRVSAKRLFPNFAFQDAPFNLKYYVPGKPETEIAYMGCRTRVIGNVYDPSREICPGRGNLSFTSINLPRIAIKSHGNINWFFEELDRKIDLCVEQLLERFEIQASKKVRNYPFLMGEGVWIDAENLAPDDEVREALKHGTLSVGFIGLAETLTALMGSHHGESEKAQNLGVEIISYMRSVLDVVSKKRKLNFTLIATPAEGLAGRFVRIDREQYGVVKNVTDREYYTNSFHVPVYYPITIAEKIRIEAPYHALTNAGHITYVEVDGDLTNNLEAFEKIIHFMRQSGVGYGSVNHPIDRDTVCGYTGVIKEKCPQCGREEENIPFERIRRITGYLVGALDRFNSAKRSEVNDRVLHQPNIESSCPKSASQASSLNQ
ncbi:MAG: anaerobic ribonucleoside triphosphate reductase [Planctomycetaceae bacterium]|jgi:ribonucleoside-triphosphate reductase|nr:anaerobic ribonucleoside triphosphate reductase [Planctomycetaceae bacterium]